MTPCTRGQREDYLHPDGSAVAKSSVRTARACGHRMLGAAEDALSLYLPLSLFLSPLALSLLDEKCGWMNRCPAAFACDEDHNKTMCRGRKVNKNNKNTEFTAIFCRVSRRKTILLLPIGSEKSRAGRALQKRPLVYPCANVIVSFEKEESQVARGDLLPAGLYERGGSLSKNFAIFFCIV